MSSFRAPVKSKTKPNDGEVYFTWFLDELIHEGYLKSYQREPEKIKVLPSFKHKREQHHKSKANTYSEFNLLQETNYTYDFRLIWEEKALYIFTEVFTPDGYFRFGKPDFVSHYIMINNVKEMVSYVDVKPHIAAVMYGGGKMSSYYTFPFIQKFLLITRKLYINKVIPLPGPKNKKTGRYEGANTCLFAVTFTPNRYVFSDGGQKLRTLHYKKTTLSQYVKRKKNSVDAWLKIDLEKNSQQSLL